MIVVCAASNCGCGCICAICGAAGTESYLDCKSGFEICARSDGRESGRIPGPGHAMANVSAIGDGHLVCLLGTATRKEIATLSSLQL